LHSLPIVYHCLSADQEKKMGKEEKNEEEEEKKEEKEAARILSQVSIE